MAKLTINVQLNSSQVKTSLNDLKSQMSTIVTELNKISVNKDLTTQINSLAKMYKEMASAAKEAYETVSKQETAAKEATDKQTQSTKSTVNAVESLRKQYADLLNTLKTLTQQYSEGTFDKTEEELRSCYKQVNELSQSLKENEEISEEQQKQLAELQTSYKTLAADISAAKEATDKLKSTEPLQPNYLTTITQVQKQYATLLSTLKNTEKYYKKGTFSTYTAQLQTGLSAITQLNTAYQTTGTLNAEQQSQLEQLISLYRQLSAEISTTSATQKSMHGTLTDLISGFAKFQLSAMLVMKPLQLLRSALSSINETLVETEDAVIEIQRVLNETISDSEVSSELYDLAKEYGQTFDNVAEIAQNFVKSGLSWNEAIEATEAALLALNVAELDAEEASEGLIAIMTQFGYEASDLTDIVDILNKTADNAAVTTEELLEALQKTGSYAAAANLSLEETVAVITALSEATAASGSNLGTSLKSLLSYTTKDSSLSVFSQLSDDMANIVSLYQIGAADILDVWEQLSVEMQSLTASQADLLSQWSEDSGLEDELATELSDIYDDLTGVYDTAGTYRKNYFIALLNNMDEVEEALNTLTDAAGYSADENETYLESYTAKLNTLQATWEGLISDEEGWLSFKKGLVDIGQAILNIVDYTGGLTTVLLAAGTAFSALFGTQILSAAVKGIKNLASSVKTAATTITNLKSITELQTAKQEAQTLATQAQTNANELSRIAIEKRTAAQTLANTEGATAEAITAANTAATAAETAATEAQTVATNAQTQATIAADTATKSLSATLNTAFAIIGIVVTVVYAAVNAWQSYKEEQAETRQEIIDTWEALEDEAISLMELYSQLESLTSKTELTTDEQEELTTITESLVDALGHEAEILSNTTDSADDYIEKLKELTQEKLRYYAITAEAASYEAQEQLKELNDEEQSVKVTATGRDAQVTYLGLTSALQSAGYGDYVTYGSDWRSHQYIEVSVDTGDAYTNYETLKEIVGWLYDNTNYQDTELFANLTNELNSLAESLDSITDTTLYSDVLNALYNGKTITTEQELNDFVDELMRANGITESYRSTVEELVSTYFGYTKAVEEATTATISYSSITEEALETAKKAWEAIEDEALNLQDLYNQYAKLSSQNELTEDEQEELTEVTESLVEALGYEAEILSTLTDSEEEYAEKLKELTQEKIKSYALTAQAAANAAKTELESLESSYSYVAEGITISVNTGNAYSDLEELKEWQEWLYNNGYRESDIYTDITAKISELKESLDDITDTITESDILNSLYSGVTITTEQEFEDYIDSLIEANSISETYRSAIEELVSSYFGYISAVEEATDVTEALNDVIASLSEDELEALIDALEAVRDAEEESVKLEEKKLAIYEAQQAVLEAQKALQEAMNSRTVRRLNAETGQWEWSTDENEVADAEEDLENAEDKLQDAIDALNEYIEDQAWDDVIDELKSGNATEESILGILAKWQEEGIYGDETPSWVTLILETIEEFTGKYLSAITGEDEDDSDTSSSSDSDSSSSSTSSDTSSSNSTSTVIGDTSGTEQSAGLITILTPSQLAQTSVGSGTLIGGVSIRSKAYDNGGVADGLGLLAKATNLPESVNDPELTSKILSPVSNAQFDKWTKNANLLFESAKQYGNFGNEAAIQQAMGNTTNNSTDNSITINGVTLGSDMGNRSLNEIVSMLSLIPNH